MEEERKVQLVNLSLTKDEYATLWLALGHYRRGLEDSLGPEIGELQGKLHNQYVFSLLEQLGENTQQS